MQLSDSRRSTSTLVHLKWAIDLSFRMLCPEVTCLSVHFWSSNIFWRCRCLNIYFWNLVHAVPFKGFFFPEAAKFSQLFPMQHYCIWSIRVFGGWYIYAYSMPLRRITLCLGGFRIWMQMTHTMWSTTLRALLLAPVVQVRGADTPLEQPNVERMRKSVVLWGS